MSNLCVIFDLDDTLFKEIDFVRSGFEHIVNYLGVDNPAAAFDIMFSAYASGGNAYEALNEAMGLQIPIEKYLLWYRGHEPLLKPDREMRETLVRLKLRGVVLGIITDGRSLTQRNKIEALGLNRLIDAKDIIISEEFGSCKPDPRNYTFFMDKYPTRHYVYVGDNPAKDFIAPNALGWQTVMLCDDGRNVHRQSAVPMNYAPQMSIKSLDELPDLLV